MNGLPAAGPALERTAKLRESRDRMNDALAGRCWAVIDHARCLEAVPDSPASLGLCDDCRHRIRWRGTT